MYVGTLKILVYNSNTFLGYMIFENQRCIFSVKHNKMIILVLDYSDPVKDRTFKFKTNGRIIMIQHSCFYVLHKCLVILSS